MLFGTGATGEPTAEEWARACGTISYEIVTRIGGRFRRRYVGTRPQQDDEPDRGEPMSRRGVVAGVVAGLGAAVTTGVLVDRRIGKRLEAAAREGDVDNLGSLRGEVHRIRTADGLDLHAEVDARSPHVGEGTAEHGEDDLTVVFVHGFALSLDCWHFQRAALRGRHRMVFYDQRSHGRSDRSEKEDATIDQLGRDLRRVLDELAPGRVVLVGHSMGGMTIVALAEQAARDLRRHRRRGRPDLHHRGRDARAQGGGEVRPRQGRHQAGRAGRHARRAARPAARAGPPPRLGGRASS